MRSRAVSLHHDGRDVLRYTCTRRGMRAPRYLEGRCQVATQPPTRAIRWWAIPVAVLGILVVLGVGITQLIPVASPVIDPQVADVIMIAAVLVFIGSLTVFFTGLLNADEHGAFGDVY